MYENMFNFILIKKIKTKIIMRYYCINPITGENLEQKEKFMNYWCGDEKL